jgi:hypothetical protein
MTRATQAYTYAAPSRPVDGRPGSPTSGRGALVTLGAFGGPALTPGFLGGTVTQAAPARTAVEAAP